MNEKLAQIILPGYVKCSRIDISRDEVYVGTSLRDEVYVVSQALSAGRVSPM